MFAFVSFLLTTGVCVSIFFKPLESRGGELVLFYLSGIIAGILFARSVVAIFGGGG